MNNYILLFYHITSCTVSSFILWGMKLTHWASEGWGAEAHSWQTLLLIKE